MIRQQLLLFLYEKRRWTICSACKGTGEAAYIDLSTNKVWSIVKDEYVPPLIYWDCFYCSGKGRILKNEKVIPNK